MSSHRSILRLALPNVLSNVSVPLISSFDTALMGGLGGTHIAAVGLGAMAFNFVYWNFGFLRMATTGMVAQDYGREDLGAQTNTFWRATALALTIGTLILVFRHPLAEMTHWLLNLRPEQAVLVDEYFTIRALAAPAALLQLVLLAWFFGRQNAVWPLYLTLVVNLTNLGLSYYLVVGAGWGIAGVAWGTVAAQYLGLLVAIGLLWWEAAVGPLRRGVFRGQALLRFFRINRDVFIRTLCLTLSFVFFYNRANALDAPAATIAANVILLQLVNWLSYGIDGFAFAAESLVGAVAGAGRAGDLPGLYRKLFSWGMGLAGVYTLVYGLGGQALLSLFAPPATAADTLAAGLRYLPLVIAFCILATPCYLLDGIFIGLTAARAMRQTMLIAFCLYLAVYFSWGQHHGNWGLWGSLLWFMVARGGLQLGWLRLRWVN